MASPRQKNEKCFHYREIGHWAQNYPNQTPNTRSSPPKSPADHGVPPLHCPCQAGQCVILVAGPTSHHPGWKYYRCPASDARRCRIFLWCKDVKMEGIIKRPICGCEAGEYRIVGKFFVCPIKRHDHPTGYRPVHVQWKNLDKCNVCHMDELKPSSPVAVKQEKIAAK